MKVAYMKTLSALPSLCEGIHQSPVDSLHEGTVMQTFDIYFDVSLHTLLNK